MEAGWNILKQKIEYKFLWKTSGVTFQKKEERVLHGDGYFWYFEDLDKITATETPIYNWRRNLFLKRIVRQVGT
jgi:hypothetical protein